MKNRLVILVFILTTTLTACEQLPQQAAYSELRTIASGLVGGRQQAQNPRDVLSRKLIDSAARPLLLVDVVNRSASATMLIAGQNGSYTTWVGADGVGLTLRGPGILTSTRGYGGDIISSDTDEVVRAIRTRQGEASVRLMRFLDGEDNDYSRALTCRYEDLGVEDVLIFEDVHSTHRVVESCRMADMSIENTYWVGAGGYIWRSIQYAGEEIGYLAIERLYR